MDCLTPARGLLEAHPPPPFGTGDFFAVAFCAKPWYNVRMENFDLIKLLQRAAYTTFAFVMGIVLMPAIPFIFAYYALFDDVESD